MSYTVDRMQELADTWTHLDDPREYEGFGLRDIEGRKIGRVRELFVNDKGEPEYVRTRMGRLGMGPSALIPVAAAVVDEENRTLVLQ